MPSESKSRNERPRRPGRFKIKHDSIALQQADLLRRVRTREGLSRVELARGLNLAPSTVGIYVDHLVEEGYLFEGKATERESGRPPTILALNPHGGRFIGVDFEARNIMAVSVDFSQKPIKEFHGTISRSDSVEEILRKIECAIQEVALDDARPLLAIGVGVPGVIDPATGIAKKYKHIKGWENVPLVQRLGNKFKVPVFLENNIRTMALAELWFGQGRGLSNFICLGIRSGVGAGIIVNGEILQGANNRAGEIGEWPCALTKATGQSGNGNFGRLEEIASFAAVVNSRRAGTTPAQPNSDVPIKELVLAAQAGDREVIAVLDGAAQTFGLALNQLSCAFNPEIVILAGGLTAFGDQFLDRLNKQLAIFAPLAGPPKVVNSTLGTFNGALGAAALAVHEWKPLAK
ncbi:MAG: ROK family protein [Limisphaerales bacterium]